MEALQHLPRRQAAALVLRDVLGFGGEEVAAMLGVGAFLAASRSWRAGRRFSVSPRAVNTQPAYATFLDGVPAGLYVITVDGDRIAALTRFLDPGPRFAEPARGLTTEDERPVVFEGGHLLPRRGDFPGLQR
ncbi:sigma factor-like helix-turn-helix DNA-binding protein [Hamadaea tsunoensis]|uniref:sigma factor-like helix-turn-helix DNA-binding protein n=1 Tax=Hamadaea tsunoensis TaxID=53368 RepID=UPI000A045CBB|nr:sigma factor-like helix-turn-helix DNA-binding protein [Hamadaea tsunoensis]